MKRIYSVLVENRSGVLAKVAGLFWRRCFNIDSLTVGETEDSAVSNMVIVSSGEERTLEQVEKQLSREPKSLPTMKLNPEIKNIFDFDFNDFTLENYDPHPGIKAPVAI